MRMVRALYSSGKIAEFLMALYRGWYFRVAFLKYPRWDVRLVSCFAHFRREKIREREIPASYLHLEEGESIWPKEIPCLTRTSPLQAHLTQAYPIGRCAKVRRCDKIGIGTGFHNRVLWQLTGFCPNGLILLCVHELRCHDCCVNYAKVQRFR